MNNEEQYLGWLLHELQQIPVDPDGDYVKQTAQRAIVLMALFTFRGVPNTKNSVHWKSVGPEFDAGLAIYNIVGDDVKVHMTEEGIRRLSRFLMKTYSDQILEIQHKNDIALRGVKGWQAST